MTEPSAFTLVDLLTYRELDLRARAKPAGGAGGTGGAGYDASTG
ncbi:hypothetical protein [Mycolicibacter minnesotensis]|nr:hypothetical protein [Mycolicibacter minnesotensis]